MLPRGDTFFQDIDTPASNVSLQKLTSPSQHVFNIILKGKLFHISQWNKEWSKSFPHIVHRNEFHLEFCSWISPSKMMYSYHDIAPMKVFLLWITKYTLRIWRDCSVVNSSILAENLDLVPSTRIKQFETTCNSSFRECDAFLWLLCIQGTHVIHIYTYAH